MWLAGLSTAEPYRPAIASEAAENHSICLHQTTTAQRGSTLYLRQTNVPFVSDSETARRSRLDGGTARSTERAAVKERQDGEDALGRGRYTGLAGTRQTIVDTPCNIDAHTHPRGLGSESHYAQLPPFIAQKLLPMGARERDLIISLL